MWKYLRIAFVGGPYILWNYPWILYYSLRRDKISRLKRYQKVQKFLKGCARILKFDLKITGNPQLPCEMSYLFVSNHQSFMDPVMFILTMNFPISFLSKKEAKKYPIIGRIIYIMDGLFLDRGNLRQEMSIMKKVKMSLQYDNLKWGIFPEGTRARDEAHTIQTFQAGSLKMAMSLGKKIVPCAIHGGFRVLDSSLHYRSYPLQIHYFDPIEPSFYEGKSTAEMAVYLQTLITEKVDEMKKKEVDYLP